MRAPSSLAGMLRALARGHRPIYCQRVTLQIQTQGIGPFYWYIIVRDNLEQAVDDSLHSSHSSFREKLLEHLFIAELLKKSWKTGRCDIEVAKSEVDSKGYDLIVEAEGILRHIQLKSTKLGGKAANQKIHQSLSSKPSGCVVWMFFDDVSLQVDHYLFFGGAPGEKLPSLGDRIAKHTKGNADGTKLERPMIRQVPKGSFTRVDTFEQLYDRLFVL